MQPITSNFGRLLMELSVPVRPTPFRGEGRDHLGYELHMVNLSGEIPVTRIDVLDGDQVLATFDAMKLNAIMTATRPRTMDRRTIAPVARATAYLWATLDSNAKVPATLRHRVTVGEHTVVGAITSPTEAAIVIGPPLRGADWMARNGPDNSAGHRRTTVAIDGRSPIAQRFATDWSKANATGAVFSGDARDNHSYFGYGAEAIAVAAGVITSVKDGIPENVPGAASRAVPITLETIGGNHVIIDIGGGRYAFYAHLQPGSLKVKVGDRVQRGQVIGLVGNSGNSTGPHLHFQLSDSNAGLATEGIPSARRLMVSPTIIGSRGKARRVAPRKHNGNVLATYAAYPIAARHAPAAAIRAVLTRRFSPVGSASSAPRRASPAA